MSRIITDILLTFLLCQQSFCRPSGQFKPRLSIADWANYLDFNHEGPGTYSFGYDIEDGETENVQFRNEERHSNGTVAGSYGYVKPDGNVLMVRYIADEEGYRASVEDKSSSNKDLYETQSVHENRLRPVDIFKGFSRKYNSDGSGLITGMKEGGYVLNSNSRQENEDHGYEVNEENDEINYDNNGWELNPNKNKIRFNIFKNL